MSAVLLARLKSRLEEALRPILLLGQSDDGDTECAAQVFIGDMPPKRQHRPKAGQPSSSHESDAGRNLPCVVIVPVAGHQEGGENVETLALICVVYNPQSRDAEAAETDLAVMLSTVGGALVPCANGEPLAKRFTLEEDSRGRILPWVKSEAQPRPFLQATITSVWRYRGWE